MNIQFASRATLRSVAIGLSAFTLLGTIAGCSTLQSNKDEKAIAVQTYTASESGMMVNSHLITSGDEAILVDAQFLRSEARNVIKMIKASGKTLKAIFITTPHPDHYLGLELITEAFPTALILATDPVIEDIRARAKADLAYWKGIYKDDLADNYILPVPVGSDELTVGNEKVNIIKLPEGQSKHGAALYIPSLETLITGDLAYNQVHLWLMDNYPNGWLRNLKDIRDVGIITTVLPGHGPSGGLGLLETNEQYIEAFLNATRPPTTRKQAAQLMKERYADWALPILVDMSVAARVRN